MRLRAVIISSTVAETPIARLSVRNRANRAEPRSTRSLLKVPSRGQIA
jgi:hypothetical protein